MPSNPSALCPLPNIFVTARAVAGLQQSVREGRAQSRSCSGLLALPAPRRAIHDQWAG
ncbi:hypothetical protein CBM2585_A80133 [Cupriavidus taiwanensis]|nr:hypothetical protein CBM2585_A80133 [Cupriavidus taiwanensis]